MDVANPALLTARLGRVDIFCSDRRGGISPPPYDSCNVGTHVGDEVVAVVRNRQEVAAAAGLPDPSAWVWLDQVHGADVHPATEPVAPPYPVADASVTTTTDLPLAIMTADCAPVVFACDDAVAVAHAGHRGLASGVLEATAECLREVGSGPVRAFLGPCIRVECYEFGERDLEQLVAHFGPEVAGRTRDDRPAFDITAAVRIALARAGVDSFDDCGVCTADSPDHFSYRRDGVTGRQVTVAVLT
jgi:purine-nucleoside/S-methyl-5'-thioadenosine phosphorylase / adenosine deaminase